MRWEKMGKIFEPKKEFPWMISYATVPFADRIKDDIFKIYFSSRDEQNRSHLGYIVININNIRKVLELSQHAVLQPGNLGTFDDSGTMGSCLIDVDNKKYLYYIGWNLGVTVPFRNAIGLAISEDGGQTFRKYSEGPIMDRTHKEPHFVASSCVLQDAGIFKMWYLSCVMWTVIDGKPRHHYHIKYAESSDGINWVRNGTVAIDFNKKTEYAISVPRVIKEHDMYKMWYSYRGDRYRIGYAESNDGITWTRKDEEAGIAVSESGWDSEMICYPFIFDHKGERYLLYNGNGYGKTGFGLAVLVK